MPSMKEIAAIADPEGLRDKWLAQRAERIAAAIASFGGPEHNYHQHILSCDQCAGGWGEMCREGKRLYAFMMAEEGRAGER